MASIITATTTSGLTQSADNSGVLQLASGTGNLVTVPSVTGTAMVSGNMPAFLAFPSSNQTISAATWTKVTLDTEIFDTNSNFASNRFTPTVAGYYQLNATVGFIGQTAGSGAQAAISFYRNGALYMQGVNLAISGVNIITLSGLIYFNGSTDYVELFCYLNGTTLTINGALATTMFSGAMVRTA